MSEFVNNEIIKSNNKTNILLPENAVYFEKPKAKPIGKLNTLFFLLLVAGIAFGAYYCTVYNSSLYKDLDFLFSSNIKQRLSQSPLQTLLSSYTGCCVFLLSSYFLGCSMWGFALLPVVSFFKGFGIGLTASYLFINYAFNGAIYYIGVMLPGAFLSAAALILLQSDAFRFSSQLLKFTLYPDKGGNPSNKPGFKKYSKRLFTALAITLVASAADMGLTLMFGNMFHF